MREWFVIPVLALTASVAVRTVEIPGATASHADGHAKEVRRIQAHFDSVLVELQGRDVSTLSPSQVEARGEVVAMLRAYRDRGAFPHNYDFDAPMPYFVDRVTGTLCAVAHLLESTGRRDIVDRVAAADNNVWVASLAGDAPLTAWLGDHGLTLEEAARIQVPYIGDGNPAVEALGSRDKAYLVGTSVTVGATAATALWNAWGNADGHRRLGTILGFATGALAMGYAGASFADSEAPQYAAPAALLSGVVSTWFTTRGMLRQRSAVAARRDAQRTRDVARVSVAPLIPTSGKGAGLSLNVSF